MATKKVPSQEELVMGERLDLLRTEVGGVVGRKITQADVASRAGGLLGPNHLVVLRLEKGLGWRSGDNREGLARAFGMTYESFMAYMRGKSPVSEVAKRAAPMFASADPSRLSVGARLAETSGTADDAAAAPDSGRTPSAARAPSVRGSGVPSGGTARTR